MPGDWKTPSVCFRGSILQYMVMLIFLCRSSVRWTLWKWWRLYDNKAATCMPPHIFASSTKVLFLIVMWMEITSIYIWNRNSLLKQFILFFFPHFFSLLSHPGVFQNGRWWNCSWSYPSGPDRSVKWILESMCVYSKVDTDRTYDGGRAINWLMMNAGCEAHDC